MFELKIETGNAAFEDSSQIEVARMLRELANKIERNYPDTSGKVRDRNGNTVGSWSFDHLDD